MEQSKIEIMDTTLRDGEQTSGVAYTSAEKLNISKVLLEEVNVDRIEIASARISAGEYDAVQQIIQWAKNHDFLSRIEILGFVDGKSSLDWINKAGGKVMNLLCKGSLNHVKQQLRKTPEGHIENIKNSLAYAEQLGIAANIYLEDWSNGMKHSPDYVYFFLDELKDQGVERFMLADTLGILYPDQCAEFCRDIRQKYPDLTFDIHTHNDYDLSVANTCVALKAGFNGAHTTVNGLGERAGNTPLSSVVATVHDLLKLKTSVNEHKLMKISKLVEAFSKVRIASNKPVIGEYVFTQTCGVHADGDNKADLYYNDLMPERFGRTRQYALGKTSGKANILKNLKELGMELSPEAMKEVTDRVVELGDIKETITKEDLPYIVSDVLGSQHIKNRIKIRNYYCSHAYNLKPVATLSIEIEGEVYESTSTGDGQYDAFMKALANIYKKLKKDLPTLIDYEVTIPPGGKTDALVETVITWVLGEREFKTRGLESDQQAAAITATLKMLNIIEEEKVEG